MPWTSSFKTSISEAFLLELSLWFETKERLLNCRYFVAIFPYKCLSYINQITAEAYPYKQRFTVLVNCKPCTREHQYVYLLVSTLKRYRMPHPDAISRILDASTVKSARGARLAGMNCGHWQLRRLWVSKLFQASL
jgi:hypothetical protein